MFEKQMDETRIIRGVALHQHGNSYLDRAQQVAEWESLAKMNRFVRDVPKYKRTDDYISRELGDGEDVDAAMNENDIDSLDGRDRVEDALF